MKLIFFNFIIFIFNYIFNYSMIFFIFFIFFFASILNWFELFYNIKLLFDISVYFITEKLDLKRVEVRGVKKKISSGRKLTTIYFETNRTIVNANVFVLQHNYPCFIFVKQIFLLFYIHPRFDKLQCKLIH